MCEVSFSGTRHRSPGKSQEKYVLFRLWARDFVFTATLSLLSSMTVITCIFPHFSVSECDINHRDLPGARPRCFGTLTSASGHHLLSHCFLQTFSWAKIPISCKIRAACLLSVTAAPSNCWNTQQSQGAHWRRGAEARVTPPCPPDWKQTPGYWCLSW